MFRAMSPTAPIGIFDSGLGGLAVLREVQRLLPHENILFLGDTARQPYGPRTVEEVRRYSIEISGYLIEQGAKMILIGCNTASVAGGDAAQACFPDTPILGMIRPGVVRAMQTTRTKRIGVWGTEITIASHAYEQALVQADPDVKTLGVACPTLLRLAEKGNIENKPHLLELAAQDFKPIADFQADTLVLGCTDFTCVRDVIDQVVDGRAVIVDPAEEIVREAYHVLGQNGGLNLLETQGAMKFVITSDELENFSTFGAKFLNLPHIQVDLVHLEDVERAGTSRSITPIE